jgi:hypothetical protein
MKGWTVESVQEERLNVLGGLSIAAILVAGVVHFIFGPFPTVLGLGVISAIALGALALLRVRPGKELGFIGIALALLSLLDI